MGEEHWRLDHSTDTHSHLKSPGTGMLGHSIPLIRNRASIPDQKLQQVQGDIINIPRPNLQ